MPVDVFAEATTEEENDHSHADDETYNVVGTMIAVFIAPDKFDFGAQKECGKNKNKAEESGVPVVDEEVRPQAAHVAADAEVLENLAGETAVGVLVIGGVADVADDDEEDGDVVEEYFGKAVVVFVPAELEGQKIGHKVGEE